MATSIIKVHAFSGAQSESPPCYMLQIDEFRCLLDCGWDEDFSLEYVHEVGRYAKDIDAVMLSHADPFHLGALPYLVGQCDLRCPIYCTIPIQKMGQLFMYDAHSSRANDEDFDLFTLDDIDLAFEQRMVALKFQQTMQLQGRGFGLSITPLPAGHMLGGTIWKIVKDDEESIVYAVDFNHKKERHLNGASFDLALRPSLLIMDCFNCQYAQSRRRNRDTQLMTQILRTVRDGGNVLISTDTAGRCLELAHLLEQIWQNQESGLMAYSLALLNNVAFNVVEFAKSQVEWMSDKVARHFEHSRDNPFAFRHLHLCASLAELDKVREPKVVLASQTDLQAGFSRHLFTQWCSEPRNSVILTQRALPTTLARSLLDCPEQRTVQLELRRRVPLDASELEALAKKKQEEAAALAERKNKEISEEVVNGGDLDAVGGTGETGGTGEEDDSDDDELATHRLGLQLVSEGLSGHGNLGYDLIPSSTGSGGQFFRAAKKTQLLFPYVESRVTFDDYGETVDPQEYAFFPEMSARTAATGEGVAADEEDELMETEEAAVGTAPVQPVPSATGYTDMERLQATTKCVVEPVMLDVKSNVSFIDFEGRSDGDAVKKIVATIRAREVILVRGSAENTNFLAEFCRTDLRMSPDTIHTPTEGDTVDVTKEGHIFQARIKDSLVSSLNFFKVKESELAWIEADVRVEAAAAELAARRAVRGDLVPTLDVPRSGDVFDHDTVFVGEPKLSDLKLILQQRGMTAEFSGGVLIVNQNVALVKTEGGKLELTGCMSEDYFKVRELLYGQYAIL